MFQWLRRIFLSTVTDLSPEQQNALFLTTRELHLFCHGLRSIMGFDRDGSMFSSSVSPATAKWAITYAELIRSATDDFKNGDIEKALRKFLRIHRWLPNAAVVMMNIGVCYGDMGKKSEAQGWLERALSVVPSEHRALLEENIRRLCHL